MPENLSDFRHIFLNDVPMMDVRAPIEFAQGAFPGVVNLPLMNNEERQKVGTCYTTILAHKPFFYSFLIKIHTFSYIFY